MHALAEAARWLVVLALALSAGLKLREGKTGSAAWHPLVTPYQWLRTRASTVFVALGFAEVALALLLVVRPRLGGVSAAILIVIYSGVAAARHNPGSGRDCQCFVGLLGTTTLPALLVRNSVLVASSVVSAVFAQVSNTSWLGLLGGSAALASIHYIVRAIDKSFGPPTRSPPKLSTKYGRRQRG